MRHRLNLRPVVANWPLLLIAFAGALAVVATIDPGGSYPQVPAGPGVTVDESFNIEQGVRLVLGLQAWAIGDLTHREVWGDANDLPPGAPLGYHLPDHPPLGRLWIGIFHELTRGYFPPADHPSPFITACARTAPATAFGLTVFLVGWFTNHWYGRTAGVVAAGSLILMPRIFGHAHLASLETFIGLTYAASVMSVANTWTREPPPSVKTAAWTGCVLGLALLTKIQAVLLPVPVIVWMLFHWRLKAVGWLAIWGVTAFIVFFVGWPWLWLDPLEHLREYLGRTAGRAPVNVWYFSRQWADRNVPWHYPWVMFLTTVPMALHFLGAWGVFGGERPAWKQPREQLLLACGLFPLILFSLPGIAVYDGARLFLVVFPLWAVLIGRGAELAYAWLMRKLPRRIVMGLVTLVLALQSYGVVRLYPCWLSYYNLAVGGLYGAERLGFEPTYWGDSVTRDFFNDVVRHTPEGATIAVAPVLHQFQLADMLEQSPTLRRHDVRLVPFEEHRLAQTRFVLLFYRKADLPSLLRSTPPGFRRTAEVVREGVPLAALYAADE